MEVALYVSVSHIWHSVQLPVVGQLATSHHTLWLKQQCIVISHGAVGHWAQLGRPCWGLLGARVAGESPAGPTGAEVQDDYFATCLSPLSRMLEWEQRGAPGLHLMPAECREATGFRQGLYGAHGAWEPSAMALGALTKVLI